MLRFFGKHAVPRAAGTLPFPAADFFDTVALGLDVALLLRFDFIEQQPAGDETIESLLACGLALDLDAAGTVKQHHARGRFVHVLSSVAARPDETFLEVGFAHAQSGHALREPSFFLRTYRERAHGRSLNIGRVDGNARGARILGRSRTRINADADGAGFLASWTFRQPQRLQGTQRNKLWGCDSFRVDNRD